MRSSSSNLAKFLSLLTISTSILGSFSTNTNAQTASSTSNNPSPTAPTLPGMPSSDPKIKLITVNCDDTTCMTNGQLDWSKAKISNDKKYTDYTCTGKGNFFGQNIIGIDDYKDGISVKNLKTYSNLTQVQEKYSKLRMSCEHMNLKAGNIINSGCNSVLPITSVPTSDQVAPTVCVDPGTSTNAPKTESPVFAYQFRYNKSFGSDVEKNSNLYRDMTGMDGNYDGVGMTYTYYTYQKDGKWTTWENPNKDNKYGGWLVYGISSQVQCMAMTPECGFSIQSSQNSQVQCMALGCTQSSQNSSQNNLSLKIQSGKSAQSYGGNAESYNYTTLKYDLASKMITWDGMYLPKVGCGATVKSSISKVGTNYKLTLAETAKAQNSGAVCTLAIQDVKFSGSQAMEFPSTDGKNFNMPVVFEHIIDSPVECMALGCANLISSSIVLGKSKLQTSKDMMATLNYKKDSKVMQWNVDTSINSGCDKVEKSFVINENGRLVIILQKAIVPSGAACTAIYSENLYSNSETSSIDSAVIEKAIVNKNFEVRIK